MNTINLQISLFLIDLLLVLAATSVAIAGLALAFHFIGWVNEKLSPLVGLLVLYALVLIVCVLIFLI
jgi:hypothetical protein